MKPTTGERLRRLQFPLILVLGTLPVCPVLYVWLKPELELLGWLFPGLCLLLSVVGMLLPGRVRFPFSILSCAVFAALGVLALGRRANVFIFTGPILCSALLLWSLSMAAWDWDRELSPLCFWLGALCHAVGQFFVSVRLIWNEPGAKTLELVLMAGFFLFVLLCMLSMNRDSMADSTAHRYRPASTMRWKNAALTVSLFILALALYFIPAVVAAVRRACLWLVQAILWLLNVIVSVIPAEQGSSQGGGGGFGDLAAGDTVQPLVLKILEWVLMVLVGVGAAVACGFLIWVLIRQAGRLLRLLWSRINRYAANVAEDYEDVVTDTREEGERENALRRYLTRRRERVDERTLDPRQRIRYRYRRLLEEHPRWTAGSTARENLPAQPAKLYEQARYSDHPVTPEDAERFASGVRRI